MFWFVILLVVFWKPIYFTIKFFAKKEERETYKRNLRFWFEDFWDLVSPAQVLQKE